MSKITAYLNKIMYPDGVTPISLSLAIVLFLNMIFYSMVSTVLFSFLPKMVKYFGASELNTGYYAAYLNKFLYRDGVTPISLSLAIIIFLNTIFYSMVSTVLFSFLPKMVKYFGASELNTGYYAGMVASSVFVGRTLSSLFWGYITDTMSKKPALLFTGVALIITTIAFGFSRNFYWAVVTRFLQGLTMGQLVILKSILSDTCDDTNMALGLSILMTAFSVGNIIGPSIGGFLVFPAEQYPTVFSKDSIFGKFSILLPNFVISIGLAIGVILAIIYLPRDEKKSADTATWPRLDDFAYSTYEETVFRKRNYLAGYVLIQNNTPNVTDNDKETKSSKKERTWLSKFKESKLIQIMRNKECVLSCLLYTLFSLLDIGFSEMFPVLAATDPKYKGMGFTTSELATVLMIVSAVTIVLQIVLLPKLNNYFGCKKMLIGSTLFLAFLCPMLPAIASIRNETALWVALNALYILIRVCVFSCYLSINIMINNSVGPDLIGLANGAGLMMASIGRLIAPVLAGSLYSWSLTNIKGVKGNDHPLGFPFDQFFVFYNFSIWSIVIAVISASLPDDMDARKTS